jgi:hypothetical protein
MCDLLLWILYHFPLNNMTENQQQNKHKINKINRICNLTISWLLVCFHCYLWLFFFLITYKLFNTQFCIVLKSIILYCIVLYSIVFYCIVFYSIVLYCILLYSILFYSILFYSFISYILLYPIDYTFLQFCYLLMRIRGKIWAKSRGIQ